jgi:hypothetical protein
MQKAILTFENHEKVSLLGRRKSRFLFVGDWITLVTAIKLHGPGGRGNKTGKCPNCALSGKEFTAIEGSTQPSCDLKPCDYTMEAIPPKSSLPFRRDQYRYCWMHGSSRLICNTLKNLIKLIEKKAGEELGKRFQDVMKLRKSKDWNTNNLTCFEAKKFLSNLNLQVELVKFFDDSGFVVPLRFHGSAELAITTSACILKLFEACNTFMKFAYFPNPTRNEFECLAIARQFIYQVYFDNRWNMVNPSVWRLIHPPSRDLTFADCCHALHSQSLNIVPFSRSNGLHFSE